MNKKSSGLLGAVMVSLLVGAPLVAGAADYTDARMNNSTMRNMNDTRMNDARINDARMNDARMVNGTMRNTIDHRPVSQPGTNPGAMISDGNLKDNIERSVQSYKDVDVSVDKGMVKVSGTVNTMQERDAVIRNVRQVNGVQSVKDELRVTNQNHDGSVGEYLDDAGITTAVKAKFLGQKGLDSLDISVETVDGVVMLTGEVDNAAQIGLADNVAKEVKGSKKIDNRLTVKRQ